MRLLLLAAFTLLMLPAVAQQKVTWQEPPEAITSLVDAPLTPSIRTSPNGRYLLLLEQPSLPPLGELAQEELRLAGIRLNPRTNGPSRQWPYRGLVLVDIVTGEELPIAGLPSGTRITEVRWSPNSEQFAFLLTRNKGIELWVGNAASKRVQKLTGAVVSDLVGPAMSWSANSKHIYYKQVPSNRGVPPKEPLLPAGPVVQENLGKTAPARTYQDLLENAHDEALFKYYLTAQLMRTDLSGQAEPIGEAAMFTSFSVSPDNSHLLVEYLSEPFSYLVPWYRFPKTIEAWNLEQGPGYTVAKLPLAEGVPIGYGSVRTGPRRVEWRSDAPASLYWVEAQDGGDIKKEAAVRDRLFCISAPFKGEPKAVLDFELRYGGINWYNNGLAIVNEWYWQTRQSITSRFIPGEPGKMGKDKTVIWDRSWEDRYSSPGSFMRTTNASGHEILLSDDGGQTLFLAGDGHSPEGKRPFVDTYNVGTKQTIRLWRSEAPFYERPVAFHDVANNKLITRREAVADYPNYYLRTLGKTTLTQLTFFENPYGALGNFKKELVEYERADGVKLSATLYLPYEDDAKNKNLPVLMWAYPQEFKSAKYASQVTDSPYQFDRIGWWSPLVWLTQGYAVLDDPKMPIVGEGETEPNDAFIPQLVGSAEAAKNYLVERGVGDPNRMAIGGHSYGAFMTANLLAHSDLFAAGIARSGAYNRTLTPFGFQAEERTLWEAPEVYFEMSPFMHSDQVNEPLLLIHGAADNNSGTFPMQSERYYNALKGHGATVRLVMLPYESHGYRGRESVLHMLWETYEWLETYVKKADE